MPALLPYFAPGGVAAPSDTDTPDATCTGDRESVDTVAAGKPGERWVIVNR
ncbi:hypothetical protein [Nocardioides sp. J9]|uniref:hypothetical protein n=1 Tax=Nocardioides sp. J9 TaxID=935844 RepID=UPI0016492B76|nr:hypothetical protein [Nocardioides sp. J9]